MRRRNVLVLSMICLLLLVAVASLPLPLRFGQSAAPTLRYIAVLSRHGVRSPLATNEQLDAYSAQPWPEWSVPVGYLTKHGETLMKSMGTYDRAYLTSMGLLSSNGCADADRFYFWSDAVQRDIDSGRAIAAGMLPDCSVEIHSVPKGGDPLFSPLAHGVGHPDPAVAAAAISGRIGGHPEELAKTYHDGLEAMQEVLGKSASKSLLGLPASVRPTTYIAQLNGPLNMAAAISENFLLEYTEGMKETDIGWGRANKNNIRSMLLLQEAYNDLTLRTPYIARANGSNLLSHMFKSMQQAVRGETVPGAMGKPDNKGLFLLGHDSDLSYFGGMLGISWLLPDYQPNSRPPGSALVFEIWQDADSQPTVRTYFITQSMDQMRNAVQLSLDTPPNRVAIFIPGCSGAGEGFPCSWDRFQRAIEAAIDPAFVSPD